MIGKDEGKKGFGDVKTNFFVSIIKSPFFFSFAPKQEKGNEENDKVNLIHDDDEDHLWFEIKRYDDEKYDGK